MATEMKKRISIDPITRLEGHGKIEIFLDDKGNVENAYFQVPEFRGFEKFCEGRPVEELPRIVCSICGVCPHAHHLAAVKAIDAVFGVEPTPTAKMLRELFYCAHMVHSHIACFYALGGPDFVVGPEAAPAERNVLGVIHKVGVDIGKQVIKARSDAQRIQEIIGGRRTHSVFGLPGGVSKAISKEEKAEIEEKAKGLVEFSKFTMQILNDIVLKNQDYLNLILSPHYTLETNYMGQVDEKNKVNFYDGLLRVVDPEGKEILKFAPKDYREHIAEYVEKWTYLKMPYLKKIGWKGLKAGKDSGIYRVAPLARLNAADGMATPIAQAEYEKMYATLKKPAHNTLAMHWARIVELIYASERVLELIQHPDITSPNVRNLPTRVVGEGVGVVEAPRGTLLHHFTTDEKGMVKTANLIVATGNNYPAMCLSVTDAARGLIKNGEVREGLLNMVEMAFRAYDPCLGCATHNLPGEMPLEVNIRNSKGELQEVLTRNLD